MKQRYWMVAGGVLALFVVARVTHTGQRVLASVTPTNRDNIFYRGVNAVGDSLNDGDPDNDNFNLGQSIYHGVSWVQEQFTNGGM